MPRPINQLMVEPSTLPTLATASSAQTGCCPATSKVAKDCFRLCGNNCCSQQGGCKQRQVDKQISKVWHFEFLGPASGYRTQ